MLAAAPRAYELIPAGKAEKSTHSTSLKVDPEPGRRTNPWRKRPSRFRAGPHPNGGLTFLNNPKKTMVALTGFEQATSCSRSRRPDQVGQQRET